MKIIIKNIKEKIKEPKVVGATILIGILACSDMYITWDIFIENNSSVYQATFLAFLLSIFLEAAPAGLAVGIAILLNKTETRVHKRRSAKIGSIFLAVVTIGALILVTKFRADIIDSNGNLNLEGEYVSGFEKFDYKDEDGKIIYNSRYEGYSKDFISMVLPTLTSLLAFGISIAVSKSDNIKKVKKEYDALYDEIKKLEDEKRELEKANMNIDEFFNIRKIDIENLGDRQGILNNKVETSVETCGEIFLYVYEQLEQGTEIYINTKLTEVSKYSNIPDKICEIDLKELINSTEDIQEWNKDISEKKEMSLVKIKNLVKDSIEIF